MQLFFLMIWWIYFFIFFCGYPLLYITLYFIARNRKWKRLLNDKFFPLLPVTYAFVSTIFWIFILMSGRMYSVIQRIATLTFGELILVYSLSALLFWLGWFRQKIYVSFLHSLPLFVAPFLYMMVIALRHKVLPDNYIVNVLRMYGAGLIIYIIAMGILYIVFRFLSRTVWLKHSKKLA